MSIVEQSMFRGYDGNILLLTVPDEEVNSEGMRAAVLYKWTERLDADFAFVTLVDLLDLTIEKLFAAHYEVNEQIMSK